MKIIEPVNQVQLLALGLWREMLVLNVINDIFGVEFPNVTALINPGQKSATPKLWAHHRFSRAKNNEARQILIFDPQAVAEPRPHTGTDRLGNSGVHHEERRLMIRDIGVHGANDTDVVNAFGDLWKNLADRNPGLSRTLELEGRFKKPTGLSLGFAIGSRRPLPMVFFQRRFGIKSITIKVS